VFVWRRWEERPEAMLAPGQETLIKLNLRLQLKQAQLALMDGDQAGFQQALAETGEILRRYAVTDSEGGRVLSNELQSLQGLNINPPLPPLTESLNRIRQLAESER
jgi:uroporphyrin-3 C-methyltransferase